MMGEGLEEMKDTEISAAIRKAGMFYFEYDPVTHRASRPNSTPEENAPQFLENYPECVINRAVKDPAQAERFRQAFLNMDHGSAHESFEVEIEMLGKLYWFRYDLVSTDEDKVICIASDISELHLERVIEKKLLEKQFEAICMINSKDGSYMVQFTKQDSPNNGRVLQDYEQGCRDSAEKYVSVEERELFMKRSSIEAIQSNLDLYHHYAFIVNGFDQNGNKQCHQYNYCYADETHRIILSALEDVTNITDHDVLTGEYNRNGFIRFVSDYLEHSGDRTQYAMLFFNIKGFKAINEIMGIESGDQVLRESIETFRESFLKPIAICRLEADHFVLFIHKRDLDYNQLGNLCHRSLNAKGKSFHFYGRCGVYPLNENVHNVSGMIDRAKLAKQFITDDYVKPYAIYNQEMRDSFVRKKKLLSDLDQALVNHEFTVYYQPIYDAKEEKIVSAEALVRWIHPEHGIIPPKDFIPEFEENGHISQLDMFVENSAKDFIIERLSAGQFMVPVAFNLSRMDFYDTEFMSKIMQDVEEIKNLDEFCRLEITESAYSQLLATAADYIRTFKQTGVKILLDDFGSGYSSFSTLSEFDFDILKLDIGFIRKIGKNKKVEKIIMNMIQMAHDLGVQVIAEGVETREQRLFLLEHSCDYIQGFYYSRPLPKEQFEALLSGQSTSL